MATQEEATILGVRYLHMALDDSADLYVTQAGLPFVSQLRPENHCGDPAWFEAHSTKLFGNNVRSGGSGTLYRVQTKPAGGRSLDIVLKWNRIAQDVPGHRDSDALLTAEFNSPFEEFALVTEMREAGRELGRKRMLTHKPLAIYVPADTVDPERLGRKEHKMQAKIRNHADVELDMYRRYAMIYEWVKGIDLFDACYQQLVDEAQMASFTVAAEAELKALGYLVRDRKPHHIIVRPHDGKLRKRRVGALPPYALVDFELLERTPEREQSVRASRRRDYLARQARRFEGRPPESFSRHLRLVEVFGVAYVCGPAESTGGILWVVGKDPALFDYFLPERWQHSPRTRLSPIDEVYETTTKDDIHLVWRLSRVGRTADMDPIKPEERKILDYGYNSPFEEVAFSIELDRRGVQATFPRAIYMTGHSSDVIEHLRDASRYASHAALLHPDGKPLLRSDREYITVWGYWNKPDSQLAQRDVDYYRPIDALGALRQGIIDEQTYLRLMRKGRRRLRQVGLEDLDFKGHHELLSLDSSGKLLLDDSGLPQVRICNFELIRRIGPA